MPAVSWEGEKWNPVIPRSVLFADRHSQGNAYHSLGTRLGGNAACELQPCAFSSSILFLVYVSIGMETESNKVGL